MQVLPERSWLSGYEESNDKARQSEPGGPRVAIDAGSALVGLQHGIGHSVRKQKKREGLGRGPRQRNQVGGLRWLGRRPLV